MTDMQRIISNPRINCFYCTGTYLYPYGNTPATDLTGDCEVEQNVDFLLLACGDIRNILFTLKTLLEQKIKPKTLNFHVNDNEDVILARNLVLLAILDSIDPDRREDLEFLWSVWYDRAISKESLQRIEQIINQLLQQGHPRVKPMTDICGNKIKKVLRYWLRKKFSVSDIAQMRNEFEKKKAVRKDWDKTLISDIIYEQVQYQNWKFEVQQFLETGLTFKGEGLQSVDNLVTNPTMICPHVDGWRVYFSGTPFHSYNLFGLNERQSLFENCLSQLKRMVQAWKESNTTKTICIEISFWLDDCLTLCNHTLPSDMKFDFIHTSNIEDHVGLLNLLSSCSGRLKRSGILRTETLVWDAHFASIEDYLNATIGIPPSYFPTVFGLHLAEDFAMGTSEPRRLSMHTGCAKVEMRWLKAQKAKEKININDSPDLLKFFKDLVRSCLLLDISSVFASAKTASSLVHVVRTMKDNVVGGAKALLDIIIDTQPQLKTAHGKVFHPHENCLRSVWLAYSDELECNWPKDENENEVLLFEIQINPVNDPAIGIARLHMGKIYRTFKDISSLVRSEMVPLQPWYLITSIAYDVTGKITFLLPFSVWSSLENSASIIIYSRFGTLFESKNIKNESRVKIIDRMSISNKPAPLKEIGKCQDAGIEHSFPDTVKITAEKNPDVLKGPLILKYRRLDIGSFPSERKTTEQFARILNNNVHQESCRQWRNHGKNGDSFRKISSLACTILSRIKKPQPYEPSFRALFIVASDREPGQAFGHDSSDIYMYFNKCHIIDHKVTLNLCWVDFERVNQYIKEGKITRMEVDAYCFMLGLPSGYHLYVTKVDAALLRKWLVLNTLKSTQQQDDQKYQWLFSSFIQPLYAIFGRIDPSQMNSYQGTVEMESSGSHSTSTKESEMPENICSSCSRKSPDLKRCTKCMSVYYCGKICQEGDWPNHKKTCQAK